MYYSYTYSGTLSLLDVEETNKENDQMRSIIVVPIAQEAERYKSHWMEDTCFDVTKHVTTQPESCRSHREDKTLGKLFLE